MHRLYLLFPLLSSCLLFSQDTISIDAVSAMPVCGKNLASAGPCATAPRLSSKVNPLYPEKARQEGKEGSVTVGLTACKDGSVSGVHVVKGVDKDIDRAALDAVSQWRFDPGTYEGKPVDVELTVQVNFRLSNQAQAPSAETPQARQNAADDVRNLYSDGVEAYNRRDYGTAVNLLRQVTSLNPQHANAWNELGRALYADNKVDAAVDALQKAIQLDPASRDAYNNLGLVYWRERKYDEAAAQFRKQIVVNPDDHYAHRNLGMMLRDAGKCNDAMPELQKGLSLTPNHQETLLAEGACDLDLGNRAQGISELKQATTIASGPGIFNDAAYALAKRNIEINLAEKWSDACLTIENTRLQNISLDHLNPDELNYVFWMAAYWDTRGWIYFLRGDNNNARSYLESAWSIRPGATTGDHLGQLYEKLGRKEDATKVYAMAIAVTDQLTRARVDLDDLADAKKRLAALAEKGTEAPLAQARSDLSDRGVMFIANQGSADGSADFAVLLSATGKPPEFRQVNGDKSLAKFTESLRAEKSPILLPEVPDVEVPLRGTLTCHSEQPRCRFAFLTPEQAVIVARNEMALESAIPTTSASHDPHVYESAAMGMRVSLPDEWKLLKEEPGSFSRPRNAMFGKLGSTAMFMLTREHFEGSPELYQKMINAYFSNKTDFKRSGEETVKRDGLTGTRWIVSWTENEILYSSVMEMFGVGEDYYRITTFAPKEIYGRYAETFENVLRSVQFPMQHVNPKLLDPAQ